MSLLEGRGEKPVDSADISSIHNGAAPRNEPDMFYCSPQVDRAGHLRSDHKWLTKSLQKPDTLVVPVLGSRSLVASGRAVIPAVGELDASLCGAMAALMLPSGTNPSPEAEQQTGDGDGGGVLCFLGRLGESGQAVFALALPSAAQEAREAAAESAASLSAQFEQLQAGARWVDLRSEGPNLPVGEAGLLAYARGLAEWHSRNCFCGRCGGRTIPVDAGHARRCISRVSDGGAEAAGQCSAIVHPRLDPAVIMCVTAGEHVLLGRQARWSPGRYSVLAGFVEVGEAFEEAVAREVEEEAGIPVDPSTIRYVASQPWPFPCSLMIAFAACARTVPLSPSAASDLRRPGRCLLLAEERAAALQPLLQLPKAKHMEELEDVRWVHVNYVRALLDTGTYGPSKDTLEGGWPSGAARPGMGWERRAAASGGLFVPGPYAVAHVLLSDWVARCDAEGKAGGGKGAWAGDKVPEVDIDTGRFKYVLLRLTDPMSGLSKLIVRGHASATYHANIFSRTQSQVGHLGLQVDHLGGGRIEHSAERREVHIYGYSQAYGQADHEVTKALVGRWYPLHNITTSDEGY